MLELIGLYWIPYLGALDGIATVPELIGKAGYSWTILGTLLNISEQFGTYLEGEWRICRVPDLLGVQASKVEAGAA